LRKFSAKFARISDRIIGFGKASAKDGYSIGETNSP